MGSASDFIHVRIVYIHRIEERERKGIELEWMSDRIRGESME